MANELILASSSPRRRELLLQIGVPFQVQGADVDESVLAGESPAAYVQRLALEKAQRVQHIRQSAAGAVTTGQHRSDMCQEVVLGSDTSVVFANKILGKPQDCDHAITMLTQLSGQTHQVVTAIALVSGERVLTRLVSTDVTFRQLNRAECLDYWRSGEPCDKAGAYGIQGLGAVFVERISGSYSAVVGLPLLETAQCLAEFDVPVWANVAGENNG